LASGLLALALVLAPALTRAQTGVPAAINYQGTLSDGQGKPVPAGYYQVQFKIWDSPTLPDAADYIWGRSFALYVATNGLFNVLLTDDGGLAGSPQVTNILSAFTSSDRYLGLTIIADTQGTVAWPVEISPRQRLVTAPYAMRANDAANLGGMPAANFPTNTTGLRPNTIPTFVGGALANSALYASGTNKVGINNANPSVELDVAGSARISGSAQVEVLRSRVFSTAVGNNNGIHFSGLAATNDWAAILLSETQNGAAWDHTLNLTVGADKGDSISLNAVGSISSLASQGTNSVAGRTVNIRGVYGGGVDITADDTVTLRAKNGNSVNVYGNVSAFGADQPVVDLAGLQSIGSAGKTFTAPTDGFMILHAFNIQASFNVRNSGGTVLYGAMLFCRGSEPGNVQVITLPLGQNESINYAINATGSGSVNAWMHWRPLGR
jgi:hypothetical protein